MGDRLEVTDELLDEAASLGRRRWPEIRYELPMFREHVARVGAGPREVELRGTELYLAGACAAADPAALRVFDAKYVATIEPSLARFRGGPAFTREIQQELRCRLLAPPAPRIAGYSATGPLTAWVRIAAVRIALNLRRTTRRRSEDLIVDDLLQDVPVPLDNAERSRYGEILSRAVRAAFTRLSLRERNLLRLHYADSVGLHELARLEGVHRATVARWLADARQRVFDFVELDVRDSLGLSRSEFQSILGLVDSYLLASLSGLLLDPHAAR
jgi:RNA polymerase sigma-70 factor, ECF subfamily